MADDILPMTSVFVLLNVWRMTLMGKLEDKDKRLKLQEMRRKEQRLRLKQRRLQVRGGKRRRHQCMKILMQASNAFLWKRIASSDWWDQAACTFTTAQWIQNFRMSRETFDYICHQLTPTLQRTDTNYRSCVPVRKRVAVAIWKLATNADYRRIGHLFWVGRSTACEITKQFCSAAIAILLPQHIAIPDPDECAQMAAYFERRWSLPKCIGAIDSTHIPIIAPQEYHQDYLNRKGWHSVLLQAVVNGKCLFWELYAGFPGSVHDGHYGLNGD
uniref:Zgc:113227 n=1 Tax=Eptatretus burgeri TaxID=7764 RepID=A0A8C4QKS3_EPTBU